MTKKPNDIPGFLNVNGFVDEEPKFDDTQRPFSISTNMDNNSFNWYSVYNWDPVSIKKEHDVEKMQNILNEFTHCNFTTADMKFIQNPLIFRLLQVLQIVVEYIAHSQIEIQTLYGKIVHENTVLKTSISRYKYKNDRLISALRNMKDAEKCPVCSTYFDSNISLDRHIHKNHFNIYDLWSHVRENKEFSVNEEVKKLNRQIDAMRILIKNQKIKEAEKNIPKKNEEEEKQKEKESSEKFNVFELSETIEDANKTQNTDETKKFKYFIEPDYQPFQKAVHDDDGPYLVFQQMSDYSISIEPQVIKEQKTKKGKHNKYVKKAKQYLYESPKKNMLNNSENSESKVITNID
mgnify:CR=1 FL=1